MQHSTTIGTIGGTLLSMVTINPQTIISAAIVAIVGAAFSFFTSLGLKYLMGTEEERSKIQFAFKRIFGRRK